MSAPILSAFDYEMSIGQIRHLRAGFLDAVNNGKLQFRYVWADGTVEWIDLLTGLSSVNFNFTNWWAQSTFQSELFMVNVESNLKIWTGGVTTLDSTSGSAGAIQTIANGVGPNGFALPDTFGGKGYTVGDILTVPGGTGGTLQVNSVFNNAIYTVASTPTAGGSGYSANELLAVINPGTGISQGGIVKVLTVDGGGSVLTLELYSQGHDYSVGTGIPTSSGVSGGGSITSATINAAGANYQVGDSCTINDLATGINGQITVNGVDAGGGITIFSITNSGSGYTTGTALVNGGSGSSAVLNIVATAISASGCTIHITDVENGAIGTISTTTGAVSVKTAGTGYSPATSIMVTGGTGTGALMQITAISNNTITKQGTKTWAQDGFYTTGTHKVNINGVIYTATGGWDTTTLTGVTPDPTGAGVAGDLVFQTVEIFANSTLAGLPDTFENDLILTFNQQLYVGSLVANAVYVSKLNNAGNFTFSNPRVTGDGIILLLNSPPKAFIAQEDQMYISAGLAQWYEVTLDTLSTNIGSGTVINVVTPVAHRLKTTGLQGAQSQAFTSKNKNDVIFVSFEPIVNTLGRVDNVVLTPQTADISFSIVNDMNKYDFTDGCTFFHQNFIFVAIPKSGVVRIYNMTKDTTSANPTNSPLHYWEAPWTIPISRFSIIDGELYGHSYLVSETYKLFDGYNFNGSPIPALAVFAYNQYGVRPQNKSENEYYIEGYISPNTTLDMTINYELNGFGGQYNGEILGTDSAIVQAPANDNSLGKESLGKNPLGGDLVVTDDPTNKFRVIKTFPRTPYYEASPSFGSTGLNDIWSLIAFGPAQAPTSEGNNPITQQNYNRQIFYDIFYTN